MTEEEERQELESIAQYEEKIYFERMIGQMYVRTLCMDFEERLGLR